MKSFLTKRAKPSSALMRLVKDNKTSWPGLIWVSFLMILSGLFKALAAQSFGLMVDKGTAGLYEKVFLYGGLAIAFYGADALRLAYFNVATVRIIDKMFLAIKIKVFTRVAHSPMKEFDKQFSGGDILSRVTNDVTGLNYLFSENATWLLSVLARGLIAFAFCLTISWQLSLIYVLLLPLFLMGP